MTSAEFTESIAFDSLEPDPAAVTMGLIAQLCALMFNVHRDRKTKPRPYTAADFLPAPVVTEAEIEAQGRFSDVLSEMRASYAARMKGKN